MYRLKIEQFGEDLVVQLPPEVLAALSCGEGDTLTLSVEAGTATLIAEGRKPLHDSVEPK
jgi:antitoxin component of MazEF toxin-antitoxin module